MICFDLSDENESVAHQDSGQGDQPQNGVEAEGRRLDLSEGSFLRALDDEHGLVIDSVCFINLL